MGPSEKTFNQVKNILNKLDRSIDSLRQQRTTPATAPATHHENLRLTPATPPTARPAGAFGRATPIRPA
ncbi:MAG: hypothetical protein HBSAPP03_24420 [Phycisphaerae bacterium]|nr:MAG: hypothetical protein HBSAPP03_24420 [Phycisphaerae bacterium]